jgi:tRNA pseudouridine55 synthase
MMANPGRCRREWRDLDGILLLDKPVGLSSNAALQRARRAIGARKAGHTGSLDPLASGMLPLCFGHATKVCGALLASSKTYRASIRLGAATSTGDAEGDAVATAPIPELSADLVDGVLDRFIGASQQVPPMHSAVKMKGRRLYELARRGEVVERSARTVRIDWLRRTGMGSDFLEIEVHCSKGTYVRTLGEDIARALGTVGHLMALRRLSVEPFGDCAMESLDELERLAALESGAVDRLLIPADRALPNLERIALDAVQTHALLRGQRLAMPDAPVGCARIYDSEERFLGLVDVTSDGVVKVHRLFVTTP